MKERQWVVERVDKLSEGTYSGCRQHEEVHKNQRENGKNG